jgi:ribokinase
MASIVVVGSINLDEILEVERWPGPGETVLGTVLGRYPGGKGANQAAAAAALGGDVAMAARVGDDDACVFCLGALRQRGVDLGAVVTDPETSTGAAIVTIARGENRVIVLPNANGRMRPSDLDRVDWSTSRVVLLQLEIPLDVVVAAARRGRAAGATVILDPAPAQALPDELWSSVDVLLPNRNEAALLSGLQMTDERAARLAASELAGRGAHVVLVKLGRDGGLLLEGSHFTYLPGIAVPTIDTTGAGDVFAGALAVALAEGQPLGSAAQFANRAAAISTTKAGAQSSLPTREEVYALLGQASNVNPLG